MELIRAFFCLPLPNAVRRDLSTWINANRAAVPGVRWVSAWNLHLTLRFCGEIPAATVETLKNEAAKLLGGELGAKISLSVGKTGTFGRPPRVLWAGLDGEAEKLRALNAALEKICRKADLPPDDKRFAPHLTLARLGEGSRFEPEKLTPWTLAGRAFAAEKVVFMRSRLTPAGPRYSALAEWNLKNSEE